MSSSDLVRWGALGALLAGIMLIALGLIRLVILGPVVLVRTEVVSPRTTAMATLFSSPAFYLGASIITSISSAAVQEKRTEPSPVPVVGSKYSRKPSSLHRSTIVCLIRWACFSYP
jgi:hypothetical protein